jgi:hypothetical protein
MTENSSNSLVSLGDLSKPANTLIKKISGAVGVLFEPCQIKRVAKAKAEAAIIKAEAEIQITDLQRRAMIRRIEEDTRYQKNMEAITAKALPQLTEAAKPDSMDDDWIANFFDKSRIVSDEQMQTLWSRVLAGEANVPGTFSKRAVNFLAELDKTEAEIFSSLCRFCWVINKGLVPLVFYDQMEIYQGNIDIYNNNGINFDVLTHLESIGLVKLSEVVNFTIKELPQINIFQYNDRSLTLEMPYESNNELKIGMIILTKVGREMASICESPPVDGFYEHVKDKWKKYLPKEHA